MSRQDRGLAVLIAWALALGVWWAFTDAQVEVVPVAPAVPACEEDAAYIVGSGDFAAGYWSVYTCGPSEPYWQDIGTPAVSPACLQGERLVYRDVTSYPGDPWLPRCENR